MYLTYIYNVGDDYINSFHGQLLDFSQVDYIIKSIKEIYNSVSARIYNIGNDIEIIITPVQE